MNTFYKHMLSPVGTLTLTTNETHLLSVRWENVSLDDLIHSSKDDTHPILLKAEMQLFEYFDGKRKTFDLPSKFQGTPFQMSVWTALQKIPFASTLSYSEIAKNIGKPDASRAVGAANGKNQLSIIVPCHRVIGKNGDLTGFAGGLKNKDFLLKMENSLIGKIV